MRPEESEFFESLFREYYNQIRFYCYSYLRDYHQADEIAQDTFHEAVIQINKLMTHPSPEGWLKKTARYKSLNSEKIRNRYLHRFVSLEFELSNEIIPDNTLLEEEGDTTSALSKIEKALTAEELYLLKRATLEKATHMEIAEELGITVWASQKRLERIRAKLEQIFPDRKRKK